ncbi:MAG: hypothetical protein QM687_11860 [Ferruginibacter sp.]
MKQLLTISALILMLLLQYSRQMAYLQCKISNLVSARHCDCEQILDEGSNDDHNDAAIPPLKIQAPDEWFIAPLAVVAVPATSSFLKKPTAFIQHFHSQFYLQDDAQPPKHILCIPAA